MARSDTVNVLIVDDDRAIQRMLADALTRQGFTVTVERDGEWALKTFEKKPFDVVILDLLLPALNGYEVARKMRSTPKGRKTPIIMISGVYKNALHQREAVQKHGAFAFIEKPMKLQTLYKTLRDALGDAYPDPPAKTQQIPVAPPPSSMDGAEGVTDRFADPTAREEVTHVERASQSVSHFQSIRGDFAQKPFPEVLAEIHRWKGTGALLLRRDRVKKIVYFRDGFPQSIKSNLLSECLGRIMVSEKMISEAECEESLRRMKQSGRQQGTVLIEMGCISPHNLNYALNLQLQRKLWDVFRWDDGEYQFNPRVMPPADPVHLDMSAAAVIYEGIRRSYDEARLLRVAGELGPLYVHPSENPLYALQDTGVGEEEQQLLQAIDGHKTVATLRALALLPTHETDLFVWAMKCAQIVELKTQPAEGRPKVSIPKIVAAARPMPPPLPEKVTPPPPPPEAMAWEAPPGDVEAERPSPQPRPAVKARAVGSLLPELSGVHSPSSAEDSLLRERLAAKVAAMRKQDYFEILGVPTTAGREEIKRAYFAMAKEYHPDKHFGSSSAEVRQLAAQIYDLISTAHDTLTDPVERERYAKEIAAGVKRDIGDEVGKILAAEGRFQKGEELMRQRQYEAARRLFEEAIQLYDQEGEFHAWLGWSMFQANPGDAATADAALRALEKAIALNPKMDKSYLFTGYIFKATGRPDKAEKQFEKAIQCNPDCTEALRELRLLGRARR
ncbi:MAG: response regulator [Myxococcaceae bacterium]|nr:response regulator [Myxococcaceae bacterium]